MNTSTLKYLVSALLLTGLAACSKEEAPTAAEPQVQAPEKRLVQGECKTVFGSEICTWASMSGDELLAFGATIPMGAAENAPLDAPMMFPPEAIARIPVPAEVKAVTGVDHLGINWEVGGHPPGPFFTPHFDFHFYTDSSDAIEAIDCSDTTKPENAPPGYVLLDIEMPGMGMLTGLCVPAMGMHALSKEEIARTKSFDASMVIGYYAGEAIFIEPMVAHRYLLERQNFSLEIPEYDPGQGLASPGAFDAVYDPDSDAYQFTFTMAAD